MQQQGFTLWFTGLSGAGKSTLANIVQQRLEDMGRYVELLDGDEIRTNLSQGLGFSKEDRDTNIRRITFVAKLLSRNGVVAITAAISPYRETRDRARREIANFVEVFVDCPLAVCEERDVKGLYKKARSGEIPHFTGVSDPYEAPLEAEITVHTDYGTPEETAEVILSRLGELGYVQYAPASPDGAYSEDEEALVAQRLKSLGYL
ncbi:MAG TPA: adenylyl-sulfate kinase [Chloroflexota bacterium]|nr:adenylyl-sulfate kinase [Chloroflexota bacterium]